MFTYALSALALAGAAVAQASNNGTLASDLEVAAAKAHFDRTSTLQRNFREGERARAAA
jgi:hypothetical protein